MVAPQYYGQEHKPRVTWYTRDNRAIVRLIEGDGVLRMHYWDHAKAQWVFDPDLWKRVSGLGGDGDYDEIPQADAQALLKSWGAPEGAISHVPEDGSAAEFRGVRPTTRGAKRGLEPDEPHPQRQDPG